MPQATTETRRMLTPGEAQQMLGVSKSEFYRLCRAGEIAYVQYPAQTERGHGYRRIDIAEIERFLAERKVG